MRALLSPCRLLLLTLLCAGCVGQVGPLDGGGDLDASVDLDAGPVTVDVVVLRDYCHPAPGASVSVLDGAALGVTDDDCALAGLRLPARATLSVQAPGSAPTLTGVRQLSAGGRTELVAIPTEVRDAAFSLAGVQPDAAKGHVVLSFVTASRLPVPGVTVTLDEGHTALPRYPGWVADLPHFGPGDTATLAHVGAAIFFNVAPGAHVAHASLAGAPLEDLALEVRAGALTTEETLVTQAVAAPGSPFTGSVFATTTLPAPWAPALPASLPFTVHDVLTGTDYPVTSASDGTYALELPFARRLVDVTFAQPPYAPFRSAEVCVQPAGNPWTWTLADPTRVRVAALEVLGGRTLDPQKGVLVADIGRWTGSGVAGISGATLSLSPAGDPPVYSTGESGRCNVGSCADGGACPSGARCEAGLCLTSTAPECSAADATASCPAGFTARCYVEGADDVCRCLAVRADCLAPSPACPDATSCVPLIEGLPDGGQGVSGNVCAPTPPLGSSSSVWAATDAGLALDVIVANLPAQQVTVRTSAPGRSFDPFRVRVTAGSWSFVTVPARP